MSHVYHDNLPGFDERQIWHDGCGECEARGQDLELGIRALDRGRLAYALGRAHRRESGQDVGSVSNAERPLLNVLGAVSAVTLGSMF